MKVLINFGVNSPEKFFIFFLLWLCVLNKLIEGNKERELTEFEEKSEYTNRIRGIHSKRLRKRILTNPSNSLVPYGSSFGDKIVPYGDDVSFGPVKLKDDLVLNGKFYNGLFINTNGFISFEHSDMFEPVDLSLIENPLVAVLFNDFDTKRSGSIYYKEVINTDTLDLISSALESDLNSTEGGISLTSAFVVTWVNVPLYGEENLNSKNTFQLVLATEANCSSYSIFYYSQIDLGSMTNFSIGITSGEDGLFVKQKDQIEFLDSIQDASNLPLKYSFRLSENESSCLRNDKYDMYPYGLSNGDSRLPRGDDISFGPISLNREISFYEKNYSSIYISTNGYVSFEFNDIFEPVAMNLIDKPTIAVLFDDFDTKRRGNVFYSQSQNKRLLESISNDLNKLLNEKPELESSMIVTWDQIPTYGNLDTKNTFQLVLGSTEDKSLYGLLIYKNISLGTQSNFSIGLTNGKQSFSDIEIEGLTEKINKNVLKKAFKAEKSRTSTTETVTSLKTNLTTSDETSTSTENSATSSTIEASSMSTTTESLSTSAEGSTPSETSTNGETQSTSIETSTSAETTSIDTSTESPSSIQTSPMNSFSEITTSTETSSFVNSVTSAISDTSATAERTASVESSSTTDTSTAIESSSSTSESPTSSTSTSTETSTLTTTTTSTSTSTSKSNSTRTSTSTSTPTSTSTITSTSTSSSTSTITPTSTSTSTKTSTSTSTSTSPSTSTSSSTLTSTSTTTKTSTSTSTTTTPFLTINKFIKVGDLLPFGTSNGDSLMTRADDASYVLSLSNRYSFYDASYNSIYVSINGYVSLDSFSAISIPSFSALNSQLIAGWSMDLDTRTSGNVYYRETTDSSILASVKSYILAYGSSKYSTFDLNSAFIVTYDNVPFFASSSTYNSFQIILTTTSSCETFAVVIYKFISSGRSDYYAGFSAKNGLLYKQIASSDLFYLANNPLLELPSYIVFKLSNDNSSLTCSKKNMDLDFNQKIFLIYFYSNLETKKTYSASCNNLNDECDSLQFISCQGTTGNKTCQ